MKDIDFIIGDSDILNYSFNEMNSLSMCPFSKIVCDFLDDFSKCIMRDSMLKQYPEVITLGFWCRKSNVEKIKEMVGDKEKRMGRGMVFHIAPSNVPINAIYTLIFGLLSGCKNIVRLSSKKTQWVEKVIEIIKHLLNEKYATLIPYIVLVRYDKKSEWTQFFSAKCLVRVIWGGDETINVVSKYPTHPRAKDIRFSDRYSYAVVSTEKIEKLDDKQIKELAKKFYNDTYLIDQNACSSPHIVVWENGNTKNVEVVKARFWKEVYNIALQYDLAEIKVADKYTILCELVCRYKEIAKVDKYGNRVYVCKLTAVPDNIEELRGKFGLFFQIDMNNVEFIQKLTTKTQTCLYYGKDPYEIKKEILEIGSCAVDRIVPIGDALNINIVWDGYNIIEELTRIIDISTRKSL